MKPFILCLLVFLSPTFFSCEKETPFSEFEGEWEGLYSGDDSGLWNVNIDSDGIVEGTAISDSLPNFTFSVTGEINEDGVISAEANVILGTVEFAGQLNNNLASGTWTNIPEGLQGTWEGNKK